MKLCGANLTTISASQRDVRASIKQFTDLEEFKARAATYLEREIA
jgi:hypothetical protein